MNKRHIGVLMTVLVPLLLLTGCADPTAQATMVPEVDTEQSGEAPAAEAPEEAVPQDAWQMIIESEVPQPVRMAGFMNESFGITGGATGAGKTHYSNDGGETWTMSEGSGGCIYGIEIIDEGTVWVCGRNTGASFSTPGGVRLSLDGGQTWEEPADYRITPEYCPLSFLDAQTGWFVSGNQLNATFDGGATIQAIVLPEEGMHIAAISLLSEAEGYVLGYDGVIYVTQDGGATWEPMKIDLQRFEGMKMYEAGDVGSSAMRFIDRETGVIVMSLLGENKESALVALRTTDGGLTWTDERLLEKLGTPFISHDGLYVTVSDLFSSLLRVFRYTGS